MGFVVPSFDEKSAKMDCSIFEITVMYICVFLIHKCCTAHAVQILYAYSKVTNV